MQIIATPAEMQEASRGFHREGKTVALVPTMGYLHEGHLSLVDRAKELGDVVVLSIFVNPTQFGAGEDLEKYPRNFERDCAMCEARGVDIVFAPTPEAMYPEGFSTWVEETSLSLPLCGKSRPGHFKGVTTVVAKLLNIVLADAAVFGRKDAQQALVIRRMARDLNMPVAIDIAPLIRDDDGVALSSRNRYLSADERERARAISQALQQAESELSVRGAGAAHELAANVSNVIAAAGGRIDYVEALDGDTLTCVTSESKSVLIAVAAVFGSTRLIDNIFMEFRPW